MLFAFILVCVACMTPKFRHFYLGQFLLGFPWVSLYVEFSYPIFMLTGDRGGTVVKVLRYKSEGHWFDPRWCHWNFSLT